MPITPLLRKLESIAELTDRERAALSDIPIRRVLVSAKQSIVRDGDTPSSCCLVQSALLSRSKFVGNGGRQILAFHPPGDIPDLQSLHLRTMDHNLEAIVDSTVGFMEHKDVHVALARSPSLVGILWRDTLIDAAIFRAWMTGLGRLSGHDHLAHLFCELFSRMRAIGLTDGFSCHLPLTQVELADAQGISTVHINRMMQDLRHEGLIHFGRGTLTILDWERLQETCDFDPAYLHLREERVFH